MCWIVLEIELCSEFCVAVQVFLTLQGFRSWSLLRSSFLAGVLLLVFVSSQQAWIILDQRQNRLRQNVRPATRKPGSVVVQITQCFPKCLHRWECRMAQSVEGWVVEVQISLLSSDLWQRCFTVGYNGIRNAASTAPSAIASGLW